MVVEEPLVAGGIYQILNLINGHSYIGQAKDLKIRKQNHFSALRRGNSKHAHLQNAFNKYEEKAFRFVILKQLQDYESYKALFLMLTAWEQFYFDTLHPEYNSNLVAGRPPGGCQKGQTFEERCGLKRATEISQAISVSRKDKTWEESYGLERATELRQNLGRTYEERYGSERAAEIKRRLSEIRKGKTYDEIFGPERAAEFRHDHSERAKRYWREVRAGERTAPKHERKEKNGHHRESVAHIGPRKGKTLEEIYGPERAAEIRQRQSKAHMGRIPSEETCRENSKANMGKHHKGETYEEIYGPERAAEIKQKLSKARKAYWCRIRTTRDQNTKGDMQ